MAAGAYEDMGYILRISPGTFGPAPPASRDLFENRGNATKTVGYLDGGGTPFGQRCPRTCPSSDTPRRLLKDRPLRAWSPHAWVPWSSSLHRNASRTSPLQAWRVERGADLHSTIDGHALCLPLCALLDMERPPCDRVVSWRSWFLACSNVGMAFVDFEFPGPLNYGAPRFAGGAPAGRTPTDTDWNVGEARATTFPPIPVSEHPEMSPMQTNDSLFMEDENSGLYALLWHSLIRCECSK